MILAGDIGGTKTNLALFDDRLQTIVARTYPSREHDSLDHIVEAFVAEASARPRRACFGVAGPVLEGKSKTTNLPWIVDAAALARVLGLRRVALLNDLEANAYGIAVLGPEDLVVLAAGAPEARGNAAVIAAGTGLGEAGLHWDGQRFHPFASEGGHASFGPRTPLEIELLSFLLRRFDHVSWETVLSGPGLVQIYEFLRDSGRGEQPDWLAEELRGEDPAALISQFALQNRSELCSAALDLFVVLYGAEAGNLALKLKATGGVYIGGGIAPKILTRLKSPAFLEAFRSKGPMRPLLEGIAVKVITNDKTALLGAAHFAALSEWLA
jgi:glucokinase